MAATEIEPLDEADGPGFGLPLAVLFFIAAVFGISSWFAWTTMKAPFDAFAGCSALFSGLAFFGVVYAILLQRKELKLQRDELAMTRSELAGQKEQLRAQAESMRQQIFENTFFQLLRLHNDIVNEINIQRHSGIRLVGRDCFQNFHSGLRQVWQQPHPDQPAGEGIDRINFVYKSFYDSHEADLGHYFRSLYNIVKLIDRSEIENKRFYTNLVRAQLSTFELALLFYNCLSETGAEKFRPLVERYALLKMVPRQALLSPATHPSLYNATAYGTAEHTANSAE